MLKLGLGAHSVPTIIGSGSGERVGDTPLLDAYSGAVAAYSVRKLRSGYSGSALRVRRDIDNTEQDIGFDSNGNLDTAAISTFCGGGGGFVSVWYDQSTSQADVTQANPSNQPQICDRGNVIVTNGKAALRLGGLSGNWLATTSSSLTLSDGGYFTAGVALYDGNNTGAPRMICGSDVVGVARVGQFLRLKQFSNEVQSIGFTSGGSAIQINGSVPSVNTQFLAIAESTGTNGTAYLNTSGGTSVGYTNTTDTGLFAVGSSNSSGQSTWYGDLQEVVHWPTDKSADRESIESNINQHYSIYPEVFEHTSGLLYDYPDAELAYSTRRLGDGAIFSMRIRRESDNAETNIGFDSNGNLDTAAIASFCGASVGKLVKLYDQTVNESNHRWPSAYTQPNVYDGTSVYTEGGNPAIYFTSNTDRSNYHDNNLSFNIQDMGMYAVSKNEVGYGHRVLAYLPTTAGNIQLRYPNTNLNYVSYPGATSVAFPSSLIDHEITSFYADSASSEMKGFANDLEVSSGSASNTVLAEGITIAGSTSNSTDFQGTFQELLVYGVSTKAVHNDLVSDINSHYLTYPEVSAHTSGLLYDYPNAAAAYSVRQLGDGATHCMRVRRDSDNEELNIAFDSNGNLDESAISTFCGTANGFVSVWYDQTTSMNNAAQSVPTSQPQIYNGTSVVNNIDRPGVDFYNVIDRYMQFSAIATSGSDFTVSYVGALYGDSRNSIVGRRESSTTNIRYIRTSFRKINVSGYQSGYGTIGSGLNEYSIIITNESQAGTVYRNNSSIVTGTTDIALYFDTIGGTDTGNAGVHSEIIIWESVLSTADRTGVYDDQNGYYYIDTSVDTHTSGLLYDYPNAAAAYSVRQLGDGAVVSMRVRRDSDNAETNIGFDSNGDLDTAAISSFCGSANGFVSIWYDQSTSGNDATQITPSSQPQIYNGTAVITENGKPAVYLSGSQHLSPTSSFTTFPQTTFNVFRKSTTGIGGVWGLGLNYNDTYNHTEIVEYNGDLRIFYKPSSGGSFDNVDIAVTQAEQTLVSTNLVGSNVALYRNSTESATDTNLGGATSEKLILKPRHSLGVYLQESIFYDSDQSSNRTAIETSINGYFSIY